jgi:5-methylcytosine-specific restriction protein B
MSMPTQRQLEIPLLGLIANVGGEAKPKDLYAPLAAQFPQITREDLAERLESTGANKWENQVQWVRQKLVENGDLDRSTPGLWRITAAGRARLRDAASDGLSLRDEHTSVPTAIDAEVDVPPSLFTWIPIHLEAVRTMLGFSDPQAEMLGTLREMNERGLKVINLNDQGPTGETPLAEIDPLTFLASFNRGITEENRKENWRFVKQKWNLRADVPRDFTGIPVLHNMKSWFFPYAKKREKGHIDLLWRLVKSAANGSFEQVDSALFQECLRLKVITITNLTMGLFWVNPKSYLPADRKTRGFVQHKGVLEKPVDYVSYRRWLAEVRFKLGDDYPRISHDAHLWATQRGDVEDARDSEDEVSVDEARPVEPGVFTPYTKQMAMDGLFMPEKQFDEAINALLEKKNLVLQGAPGVGKTFVAERIAKALIGSDDPRRLATVQFHQSYSYEDFVQGFRPTAAGTFELKYGLFYQFCTRARQDEASGRRYVFIIDEINRGNLSKILGELMMLIEPDKRGKKWAIPLAYATDTEERFYVPTNVYLIGMMNTADRSLALVDYALRRRFRFISLQPGFSSAAFQQHLARNGVASSLVKRIITKMTQLNEAIAADTKNLGPGYQIGHSYFCPADGLPADEHWYRRVIELEIVPLIREYWFDDEKKVDELRAGLLS